MSRYVFDIESDGLLDSITKIHSLVLYDLDTRDLFSFTPDGSPYSGRTGIEEGIELLMDADLLVGHNILKFDLPAIEKVTGRRYTGERFDTLTVSRLIWTNLADQDFNLAKRKKLSHFPADMVGKHSLKAWGFRLGILKGNFGELTDWKDWSPEMQSYCEQDVRVSVALYERIQKENYSPRAIKLEHDFQDVIFKQERFGFGFDVQAAQALSDVLTSKRDALAAKLREVFPDTVEETKTPAYWTGVLNDVRVTGATKGEVQSQIKSTYGKIGNLWVYERGPNIVKRIPFNPGSRLQVAERLMARGWKPTSFTDTGQPQVDDDILEASDIPEAEVMAEFFMLEKRIGQLAEGKKAWLKLVNNGRIHGELITNGAVTGRCTHQRPNVSQVPAVKVPYGRECRSLFTADSGFMLVGADASGLELRCLGHYLAAWDDGDYGREVVSGDIHTRNQQLAGLPTRDNAKTFIYGLLYGAGDAKIGSIISGGADDGARLRAKFMAGLPAYAKLVSAIKARAKERGYLLGLDGRRLHVRSPHAALNTLLQSAGALIVKLGTVLLYEACIARGWKWGEDFANVAHIHDEVQIQARPEIAEELGKLAVASFTEAGKQFGFRVPIDGTYSVGPNWAATH